MSLPLKRPASLSIFQRTILMGLTFVLILVIATLVQIQGIGHMVEASQVQSDLSQRQNEALRKQNRLLAQQEKTSSLQRTVQSAFDLYFEYLFWRYNSVITEDQLAVENGDEAEQKLREILSGIYDMDEELGEAADAVAIYLDDFNDKISEAIEMARNDVPKQQVISLVGRAQSDGMAMNAMFEIILDEASAAVQRSNDEVKKEGEAVLLAATEVSRASQQAQEEGEQLRHYSLLILLAAVLLSLSAAWLFSRSITRPIHALKRAIHDIEEQSDLTARIALSRKDEIGEIADAFNSMIEKFQGIVGNLAAVTGKLTRAWESSADAANTTRDRIQHLHAQSDAVAEAVNTMKLKSGNIHERTSEATDIASQAQQACEDGKACMQRITHEINTLDNDMTDSAEVVRKLADESESIGGVLDVIRNIADQTNLLALNAAIEAARAGDQGRGFAVVADEVRTLALRTGQSTNEIQTMIETLQRGSDTAVKQIDHSRRSSGSAVEESRSASNAMDGALQTVATINDTNHQIAASAAEQIDSAEQVDRSIGSIRELADTLLSSAEDNQQSIQELFDLATNLRNMLASFKYDDSSGGELF